MIRTTCLLILLLFTGCSGGGSSPADGGPDAGTDGGDAGVTDGWGDSGPAGPLKGFLQLRLTHNLADDSCLPDDCYAHLEELDDVRGWLDLIDQDSDMAVLHWDRGIPWLVFDQTPPGGADPIAFYDGLLDPDLLDWINVFQGYFAAHPVGYLAVSILSGSRNRPQHLYLGGRETAPINGPEFDCLEIAPGSTFSVDAQGPDGPIVGTFEIERAFRNFVTYLALKLGPDYLAAMVEINAYYILCPQYWDGMLQLYRNLVDHLRGELGNGIKIFATLTYAGLLKFNEPDCAGGLAWEPCSGQDPVPDYPDPDPLACYPLDLTPLDQLDQGDRMDLLALSFYPDQMQMTPTPGAAIKAYPVDWDGLADCQYQAPLLPFADPWSQLDRFGWQKPVAVAETGARSCMTYLYHDFNGLLGPDGAILTIDASLDGQAFWLEKLLTAARERQFEFVISALREDYPPIGRWILANQVMNGTVFSLLNLFACMGIYDDQGSPKPGVTGQWQDF